MMRWHIARPPGRNSGRRINTKVDTPAAFAFHHSSEQPRLYRNDTYFKPHVESSIMVAVEGMADASTHTILSMFAGLSIIY
jgi:hypothetical protein